MVWNQEYQLFVLVWKELVLVTVTNKSPFQNYPRLRKTKNCRYLSATSCFCTFKEYENLSYIVTGESMSSWATKLSSLKYRKDRAWLIVPRKLILMYCIQTSCTFCERLKTQNFAIFESQYLLQYYTQRAKHFSMY